MRIPDLPGCYGAGASAEEAIGDAASAAGEWIEHQTSGARTLPPARTAAAILASGDIDVAAGEAAVVIPVMIDDGRTVRAEPALENELRRVEEIAPLIERLRPITERIAARPPTGLEADKAFFDALNGGA